MYYVNFISLLILSILLNNTNLQSKLGLTKQVFYGYFVGAEHEYDIKNCLALVSKIQEPAFMYNAFRFQNRVHKW